MTDEHWKHKVDESMKACNEQRVRLEEQTKAQQKEIDTNSDQLSDLYDYKNDIYRKLTVNTANAISIKDHNTLVQEVTRLKTEKKFLPYVVMIISLVATIISGIYITNKLTRGEHVGKSSNQNATHERLPVLRSEMPKDSR